MAPTRATPKQKSQRRTKRENEMLLINMKLDCDYVLNLFVLST